jgi:hypothetical protein
LAASRLTPLQTELLAAFFRHEGRFRLTGGAVLAGFLLGHRDTEDLDLFTSAPVLDDGDRALRTAAAECGAAVENLRTSPDFRRRLVRRAAEAVVVDLVRDPTPHAADAETMLGSIRVDTAAEILANKLCTLLSRSELRDLVDVAALEASGLSIESALAVAHAKDGGLTPAQLAWVLSSWTIADDARIPGGGDAAALRAYLARLVARLSKMAWP